MSCIRLIEFFCYLLTRITSILHTIRTRCTENGKILIYLLRINAAANNQNEYVAENVINRMAMPLIIIIHHQHCCRRSWPYANECVNLNGIYYESDCRINDNDFMCMQLVKKFVNQINPRGRAVLST